ncbi:ATP-dependent zinc metalloprotease FtsH [Chelativorans salis]|uniref:ATP-dependent zinc metalloprotease FtsH n=1 Tax=Chelativorans salis TaxID=2978478 RepID=A0ABT2LU94_9HYPH|nr:ATP-dependent zinc metalloprotease FtsH [Chelativorans sp. EGI FJ00035]MCT7378098.1 ATP-dependent zinc metalloprotease FtsH [Chelativorans sp. EGI FJ00035]
MDKKHQINLWYVIAAVVLLFLFQGWYATWRTVEPIPYSEFEQSLKDGKIAEVQVGEQQLVGQFKKPLKDGRTYFTTNRVDPAIADELTKYGVKFDGTAKNTFLSDLLSWVIPIGFFFALWLFFIRRVARQGVGGLMTVGKSKAKVYVERDTKVAFSDVAGVEEAKDELKEIVAFLRDPASYGRLGARVPKGILLVGPPGTGKTLLARAVAGEAGVPFFSISGSEFVEMFVGVGAARVRDLFEQARKAKPCIIFIDELDALGRARAPGGMPGGFDEKEQTLNQLLTELDGFDPSEGIVLLGATNRPEVLDQALLRAGRFDRQVLVDRPDKPGRLAILQVHIRKILRLAADIELDQVAALTTGFTGADLANLVNEAALLATRRGALEVTMADFTNAIERIVAGLEKKSRLLNPHERRVVAHHEMGHALVAASLPGMDPVHKVSIIPRGVGALGYTIQRPTEERFLQTTRDLKDRMAVLMGGRVAERLVFGEISTGAADDLAKVTDIARHMVTRFGMVHETGEVVYEQDRPALLGQTYGLGQPKDYAEATAREIDLAVMRLVEEASKQAEAILTERRADLHEGAELLLKDETITAADFPPITGRSRPGEAAQRPGPKVAVA